MHLPAGRFVPRSKITNSAHADQREGSVWPAAARPGKGGISTRWHRLARNTIIESTLDVGPRCRCTMNVGGGRLGPGAMLRPVPGEWHPQMSERLDGEELADWGAGRNAVYQLAALTNRRLRGRAALKKAAY